MKLMENVFPPRGGANWKGRCLMDFNAVYHRANDNYCYSLDEEQLVINIRTGYDVKYVNIIHGDPLLSPGILGGGEMLGRGRL